MTELTKLLLIVSLSLGYLHVSNSDGQRDYGEACSLRSQIANLLWSNSPEGCISSKGLVCMSHKCVCADPTNVYEVPVPEVSESGSSMSDKVSAGISFFKKLFRGTTTTTTSPPPTSTEAAGPVTLGKCVGRAGSPCFTQNSTCVKHAVCEGSPRICKCQGIYGSNTEGRCSKTANVVNQVIKQTIGR